MAGPEIQKRKVWEGPETMGKEEVLSIKAMFSILKAPTLSTFKKGILKKLFSFCLHLFPLIADHLKNCASTSNFHIISMREIILTIWLSPLRWLTQLTFSSSVSVCYVWEGKPVCVFPSSLQLWNCLKLLKPLIYFRV